jgi:hypothetical protein
MFPLNTILAWNIKIIMNKKYDNSNIIIVYRAYFLQNVYRSMIGSLLYLCASRPDIILSVCMCARFQAAPKEYDMVAVKRIF